MLLSVGVAVPSLLRRLPFYSIISQQHLYRAIGLSCESCPRSCQWTHSRTTGRHPFLLLILCMCFSYQFVIKGDAEVFNILCHGQLHSLIFKSYFIGLPFSCKVYNFCFLKVPRQSFDFTPGVYFPKTSLRQLCCSVRCLPVTSITGSHILWYPSVFSCWSRLSTTMHHRRGDSTPPWGQPLTIFASALLPW